MSREATAIACTNLALCKYWGKTKPGSGPATPSISLTLAGLHATTTVREAKLGSDSLKLDGQPGSEEQTARIGTYLDEWRAAGLLSGHFAVESRNNFPTAAGLASSAAGYAALATALSGLTTKRLSTAQLSKWARRGSGSAARSIYGGMAVLGAGEDPAARQLYAAEDVPWGMVVAVVKAPPKEIGSRAGMRLSRETSPFYRKWVLTDRYHSREMLAALQNWDLSRTGELIEQNMLAMHACMLTTVPPLYYWSPATLELFHAVRSWRRDGLECYATTDAGPHVGLLCHRENLSRIAELASKVAGVERTIACLPGPAASLVEQA